AIPLGSAEADIAADFRQPDAPDELSLRRPHGHATVAHAASGIARAPKVAIHVSANTVRPALHVVDHEAAEKLAVRKFVVRSDVEHVHVAITARTGITRAFPGADHVEPLGIAHRV